MRLPLPALCVLVLSACQAGPLPQPGPTTLYLLGHFAVADDRKGLAEQLRTKGYRVSQDLDDSVDTVVVGTPPRGDDGAEVVALEEIPEYRRALRRGLRLLSPLEAMALPAR